MATVWRAGNTPREVRRTPSWGARETRKAGEVDDSDCWCESERTKGASRTEEERRLSAKETRTEVSTAQGSRRCAKAASQGRSDSLRYTRVASHLQRRWRMSTEAAAEASFKGDPGAPQAWDSREECRPASVGSCW